MKLVYLFWVTLLLWSCQEPQRGFKYVDELKIFPKALQSKSNNLLIKDIPLGTDLLASDLKFYSYYGQFIDNNLLDFYTAENPEFRFLDIKPESLVLEYHDGVLTRKRYRFEQDIFGKIESQYLKRTKIKIDESIKVINIKFKNKIITYHRSAPFFPYEKLYAK